MSHAYKYATKPMISSELESPRSKNAIEKSIVETVDATNAINKDFYFIFFNLSSLVKGFYYLGYFFLSFYDSYIGLIIFPSNKGTSMVSY